MKYTKLIILSLLTLLTLVIITPTVYASSSSLILGPEVIYKDKNSLLTAEQILSLYSTEDNNDLEIVSDKYTGFGNIPSSYDFTIGIKGTFYSRKIVINVKNVLSPLDDKNKPIIYAASKTGDRYQIYLTKDKTLGHREIVTVMERLGAIEVLSDSGIQILSDTYSENHNSPGNYIFEFNIVQTNGMSNRANIQIIVTNSESFKSDFDIKVNSFDFDSIKPLLFVVGALGLGFLLFLIIRKKR